MNRRNLKILAHYLDKLPANYRHFEMNRFYGYIGQFTVPEHYTPPPQCGTCACAAGHGPAAGLSLNPDDNNWMNYIVRVFGFSYDSREGQWCFGGMWEDIDNTPQGAAKRIFHMLQHGVPEDAEAQRDGEAPYLFAD